MNSLTHPYPWPVIVALALTVSLGLSSATRADDQLDDQLGELKIRFEYGGNALAPKPVRVAGGLGGLIQPVNEQLLVHPVNNGIKNVVVYVYTPRRGSQLAESPPSKATHTLACRNGRLDPHVLIARAGDTLKVVNADRFGHNLNLSFYNNDAQNITLRPNQQELLPLREREPAPIPISSNIHPWMRSWIVVLEHPFAAVSDENGVLSIKGLPTGDKLIFRLFHEAGRLDNVIIDGVETRLKSSRLEVAIFPGLNDLGTFVVPADALGAE